jgi:hypothetical protein
MKKWLNNISKRTWTRSVLVAIFFIILSISLAGEKVAQNDGIGWDGENYLNTIQHFTELITTHSYDQYAIQRIMPWGLVNVVFQVCHIEPTPHNALIAGGVLNVLALVLAIFFFFRISNMKKLKESTEVIAFASLFYSYALLKIPGYYILLSDTFGFLWGMMMLYLFLANKRWWLSFVAILGAVNWPGVALLCGLVLCFLPQKKLTIHKSLNWFDASIYYMALFGLAFFPLVFQLLSYITPPNHDFHQFGLDGRPETSIPYFMFAVLCACAYLYYMIRPFRISLAETLSVYNNRKTWIGVIAIIICFFVVNVTLHKMASAEEGALNNKGLLEGILTSCACDPFCFIESFFSYFGPIVLIILFLWSKSVHFITEKGLGYFFVIALAIFFSLRPEARVSIMFLPFVALPILEYIDTQELKKWVMPVYALVTLFLSHVWFPINVEGMETAFEEETFSNLSSFPAERYFMCTGHWQSHEMYAVFMIITVLCGAILYVGLRKKWFIEPK